MTLLRILDRLQAEQAPELLEWNSLGSVLKVSLCPTVQVQSVCLRSGMTGFFHVLRETLL